MIAPFTTGAMCRLERGRATRLPPLAFGLPLEVRRSLPRVPSRRHAEEGLLLSAGPARARVDVHRAHAVLRVPLQERELDAEDGLLGVAFLRRRSRRLE